MLWQPEGGVLECCVLGTWAARYSTWLLIKLTPEGVVFPSLSMCWAAAVWS